MIFEIAHRTTYRYSAPVFLEPHTIRLRPRNDPFQRLTRFDLRVFPEPSGLTEILDAEANPAAVAWFDGTTDCLEIRTLAVVETLRENPFDYLITHPEARRLPPKYPVQEERVLAPYLSSPSASTVVRFAEEMGESGSGDTLQFLSRLTDTLYRDWSREVREVGDAHPPEHTLRERRGSCRDLTVLFMEVCRVFGLAGRFVSGYQQGALEQQRRYMHAWPEVYLPGAGWRGYDPTNGLAVADRHVALASSASATGAAPTQGTFRGGAVRHRMDVDISIRTRPAVPPEADR